MASCSNFIYHAIRAYPKQPPEKGNWGDMELWALNFLETASNYRWRITRDADLPLAFTLSLDGVPLSFLEVFIQHEINMIKEHQSNLFTKALWGV